MSRKNVINLREWLKKARKNNRYTQRQLSELLGISQNYYSDIEMYKTQKNMDLLLAVKLADVLNIPIEQIIEWETQYPRAEPPKSAETAAV